MSSLKLFLCVTMLSLVTAGCDSSSSSDSSGGGQSMDALAGQVDAANAQQKEKEAAAAAKAAADQKAAEAAAAAEAAKPRVVGRGKVQDLGYGSAIINARRHVLNESESWAWKQAVSHFRATNDRKPKDTAEFMKQIIEGMQVPLPHKEEDEEFLYDPNGESDGDFGQLYVVTKQPAADSGGAPPPAAPAPGQK
jgi:hypothetical protein